MAQDGIAVLLMVAFLLGLVAWFVNGGLSYKNQREFRHVYLGVLGVACVLGLVAIVNLVK
jgi:hypothetical protein